MVNLLLINPPTFNMLKANVPQVVDDSSDIGYIPPLGLLYVASMVEKTLPDCKVTVVDADAEKHTYTDIRNLAKTIKPDIVGITATSFTLIDALLTAQAVKEATEYKTHICVGGPHPCIYPFETLQSEFVDSVIVGEGEFSFAKLIKLLTQNQLSEDNIDGILYKLPTGEIRGSNTINYIQDLNILPHPARHLIRQENYWSILSEGKPATSVITSRGCPYRCVFCDRPTVGKNFRFRSAANVVDELESTARKGVGFFLFYDDTFTVNKKRVLEVCEEIVRRRLNIRWDIRARVDNIDEEILRALKKAGCVGIHYGVESGNPEILKNLSKGITVEQVRTAFRLTKKAGIRTLAYFMIGNPGETKEQMLESIEFAKEISPDYLHIGILTPFPATPIYKKGLADGILKEDYWLNFAKHPDKNFIPPVWDEKISREELAEILVYAYKSFYLRPINVLKQLIKVKNLSDLIKKSSLGLKLMFMPRRGG